VQTADVPASETYYLGIDVGGTNIKVGVVTGEGKSLSKVSVPTDPEHGPDAGVVSIGLAAEKALAASGKTLDQIRAVGLATPGTMDIPAGMILERPIFLAGSITRSAARVAGAYRKGNCSPE
jgi:glucokinase